jgi:hypothetical protein
MWPYTVTWVINAGSIVNVGRVAQSVQRLATGWNGPGIESRLWARFSHLSRPALWPTKPPVQLVSGLSRG